MKVLQVVNSPKFPYSCTHSAIKRTLSIKSQCYQVQTNDNQVQNKQGSNNLVWEEEPQIYIQDIEQAQERKQNALEFAIDMAREAWLTKGEDIRIVDVEQALGWTSYFIFVTVYSRPQLNAILGKMVKKSREFWNVEEVSKKHGRSAWEVLDFGDVVIHAFSAQLREYYSLESKFNDCKEIKLNFEEEVEKAQQESSFGWSTTRQI
eukprot:TRINITY_DN3027_c1_g1_i1.p1 TRINITY_DN3027_c1_g1~~TRINITY_DN3027_c1_g1_i1.p1  ORF type:complete len:221 (-),score=19.41 TRINITY_DN3027_c1_g1_i1:336-953(-)